MPRLKGKHCKRCNCPNARFEEKCVRCGCGEFGKMKYVSLIVFGGQEEDMNMIETKDLVEFIKSKEIRTIYHNETEYVAEIVTRLWGYDKFICPQHPPNVINIEFIKEQAEYFNNHVCNKKLEDWQIENELIMMFREAGMGIEKKEREGS